jgi:hypothetical protein
MCYIYPSRIKPTQQPITSVPVMRSIDRNNQCNMKHRCRQSGSGCYSQLMILSTPKTTSYAEIHSESATKLRYKCSMLYSDEVWREEVEKKKVELCDQDKDKELSPHALSRPTTEATLPTAYIRCSTSNSIKRRYEHASAIHAMISGISRLLGLSFLFCLGLPFALFALFTTTLALGTLLLRLIFVYFDLLLAVLNGAIVSSSPPTPLASPSVKPARRKKHTTPPTPSAALRKTPSFASLVGSGTDRDFEGLGGWRYPESTEEEAVWMNMNRHLELPASPAATRKHRRTGTGNGTQSPLVTRTLARTSGSASPEGYFSIRVESREGMGLSSRGDA